MSTKLITAVSKKLLNLHFTVTHSDVSESTIKISLKSFPNEHLTVNIENEEMHIYHNVYNNIVGYTKIFITRIDDSSFTSALTNYIHHIHDV